MPDLSFIYVLLSRGLQYMSHRISDTDLYRQFIEHILLKNQAAECSLVHLALFTLTRL